MLILEVPTQNQRRLSRCQICKVALSEEDTLDPEFKDPLVTMEPDYVDFVRAQDMSRSKQVAKCRRSFRAQLHMTR